MSDDSDHELFVSKKTILGGALILACFSVLSWWRVFRREVMVHRGTNLFGLHLSHDPIRVFALPLGAFIFASVAFSSRRRLDRFVFGIASFCMVLASLKNLLNLGRSEMLALEAAEGAAWAIAAILCASALVTWTARTEIHE